MVSKTYILWYFIVLLGIVHSNVLPTNSSGCCYDGKFYPVGNFQPSQCTNCVCTSSGSANCLPHECGIQQCFDAVMESNQCCPTCPNGPNCRAPNGTLIKFGETSRVDSNTMCSCTIPGIEAVCYFQRPPGCEYNGQIYPVGPFQDSPCSPCECTESGYVRCAMMRCDAPKCVNPLRDPSQCCPTCPDGPNCMAPDQTTVKHGNTYRLNGTTVCSCRLPGFDASCSHQPVAKGYS